MKRVITVFIFIALGTACRLAEKTSGSIKATSLISLVKAASILPPICLKSDSVSIQGYPLANKINIFLHRQKQIKNFKPTGFSKGDYLKIIKGEVLVMEKYQDSEGHIIDPVDKVEKHYATPCYAHSVAVLAAAGYTKDSALIESGMKALDASFREMVADKAANNHGDFFTYPVMFAFSMFQNFAQKGRIEEWRKEIQSIVPKKLYAAYLQTGGNWGIVNSSGEFLRYKLGFTSLGYTNKVLEGQVKNFTDLGMYHESGDPLPYDLFPRHYLAGILLMGYKGAIFDAYRDILWKGALTSLFMESPFGELPTGYRSSQHIWNEAEECVVFEIYARACENAGKKRLAGVFKRAAMLSLSSIKHWIRPDGSGYIVKNRYPIQAKHGYEGYSDHTTYNMLACSMLAQAWAFSNDKIKERPAPADIGGFVVPEIEVFHKIFANAGGTYIEYDTKGDHIYNPTGLIRIHIKGGNPQLGPSDGCAPRYSGKGVNVAVGPAWQNADGSWSSLAELSPTSPQLEIQEETPSITRFKVTYEIKRKDGEQGDKLLVESFVVKPSSVTVTDELTGDIKKMKVTWPMLVFDGQTKTNVSVLKSSVSLKLYGRGNEFTVLYPKTVHLERENNNLNHRNGLVDIAIAETTGNKVIYRFTALTK